MPAWPRRFLPRLGTRRQATAASRSRRTTGLRALSVLLLLLAAAPRVQAQQRPLVTEDPEVVGAGRVLIEGGLSAGRKQLFPASGLDGHLFRGPIVGVSIGISSIAELQIDGGLYQRLAIRERRPGPLSSLVKATGNRTQGVEDLYVGTKLRLVPESARRPGIGFRFSTKLPTASNESGLGLDTTEFYASALVGKNTQSLRVVGNIGVGILADPTEGHAQNDVLTYGVSVARALTERAEFVSEINGRVSTRASKAFPGTETRGLATLGARYTRNAVRVDAAVFIGLTTTDPSVGLATGFTYVFHAFDLP